MSATDSAVKDMSSIAIDESVTANKSTDPTTSLVSRVIIPKEPEEAGGPDPLKIKPKLDVLPALQTEDLSIATDDVKSIMSAIIAGDEEKLRGLLQIYDVESKDDNGYTPLILGVRCRNEKIVRLLLEIGANPGAKDSEGRTTLHWLSAPLPEASKLSISKSLVDLLLKDRPPLDVPNNLGTTPLMSACGAGEQLLTTKLINHGTSTNWSTTSGTVSFS